MTDFSGSMGSWTCGGWSPWWVGTGFTRVISLAAETQSLVVREYPEERKESLLEQVGLGEFSRAQAAGKAKSTGSRKKRVSAGQGWLQVGGRA